MNSVEQKKTAFCYSTKDRVDLSKQTLPAVLKGADKFDLFVVDGSSTEEGKAYAQSLSDVVKGIHLNITGGADIAIVYALSMMLDKNYEFLGLIENDVQLEENWFERISILFDTPVGSVSARCYSDRILEKSDGCAVMANIGAGMVLFSRKGAEAVLDFYRTGSLAEYLFWPYYFLEKKAPAPHEIADTTKQYQMTADWFFESSLLARSLLAVAHVPSLAHSADNTPEQLQLEESSGVGDIEFSFNNVKCLIGNYEPGANVFYAQPHQIFIALPGAFSGDWKIVWAKHNGPFGMRTKDGRLTLPVHGTSMSILLDIKAGSKVDVLVDGVSIGTWTENSGYSTVHFSTLDYREIVFQCTGDVVVMTTLFSCPQRWFLEGYGLRYRHLSKYL